MFLQILTIDQNIKNVIVNKAEDIYLTLLKSILSLTLTCKIVKEKIQNFMVELIFILNFIGAIVKKDSKIKVN